MSENRRPLGGGGFSTHTVYCRWDCWRLSNCWRWCGCFRCDALYLDTKPVCKSVISHSSVAENQAVNFTCSMTYAWHSDAQRSLVIPSVNVSFGWEGTSTTPSTHTLSPQQSVGSEEATMTVDGAKKPQIPAQNCTIRFTFAPAVTFVPRRTFAVNSVSFVSDWRDTRTA